LAVKQKTRQLAGSSTELTLVSALTATGYAPTNYVAVLHFLYTKAILLK